MLRIVQHLICQALFDHMPALHHHQTVGQQAHHGQIMGDDDGRKPHFAHQPAQQVQQTRLHADIKAPGRFVHEHQTRRGHQIAGDLQALLHTAGKGARAVVDAVGCNFDPAQPVDSLIADVAVMPRADGHQAFTHIAACRYPHPQAVTRVLVHKGPIGARHAATLGLCHCDSVAQALGGIKDHAPGVGGHMARKARQQRRFA